MVCGGFQSTKLSNFDKVYLVNSNYWPEYGVQKEGKTACFECFSVINGTKQYNFEIGSKL